jgi:hypothetical protein
VEIVASALPENFALVHQGEEEIRGMSLETIKNSSDLALHIAIIERAANVIHYFIHREEKRDEDEFAVRLLGMRMFNGLNTSLKLLLSGYYQNSTLQQRDTLETVFLLDYFSTDKAVVTRWREADDKAYREEFSPVAVRKKLDERDSYTGKKRAEAYKLFSTLAGHPNPKGFDMLRLPSGDYHCGPFFLEPSLVATLSELAKTATQSGQQFSRFFSVEKKADAQAKIEFLDVQIDWFRRFYEKETINTEAVQEMRDLMAKLPD